MYLYICMMLKKLFYSKSLKIFFDMGKVLQFLLVLLLFNYLSEITNQLSLQLPRLLQTASELPENQESTNDFSRQQLQTIYCTKRYDSIVKQKSLRNQRSNEREEKVNTIYGFEMFVDEKDHITSQTIFRYGTWEPAYISLMAHLIRPGDHVLFLGSSCGIESLITRKLIGSTGQLFIFQPQKFNYQLMNKNIELNNLTDRSQVFNIGASNQIKTANIVIFFNRTKNSFISSDQKYQAKAGEEILPAEFKPVDRVISKDQNINFGYVDVGEMTVEALLGMKEIISRSKNLIMLVNWEHIPVIKSRESIKELINFLKEEQYSLYRYVDTGVDCNLGKFIPVNQIKFFREGQKFKVVMVPRSLKDELIYPSKKQQTSEKISHLINLETKEAQQNQAPDTKPVNEKQNDNQSTDKISQHQSKGDIQHKETKTQQGQAPGTKPVNEKQNDNQSTDKISQHQSKDAIKQQKRKSYQITIPYEKQIPLYNYKCYPNKQYWRANDVNANSGSRMQLVETIYGFQMYVDRYDGVVSKSIKRSGTWEPQNIKMMAFLIEEGDTILNLGSQSGLEALIMGSQITEKGHLFIFEPYSFSNYMVTSNVHLNGLKSRTTIFNYGASNKNGTAKIRINYRNTGGSQIVKKDHLTNRDHVYDEIEEVQLRMVDDLLPKNTSIDFALIDIEHMEGKAFIGMKQTIRNSPNLVIFVEWNYGLLKKEDQQIAKEAVQFLNTLGYRYYLYHSSRDCKVGRFQEISKSQILAFRAARDILMVPDSLPLPTTENSPKELQKIIKQKAAEQKIKSAQQIIEIQRKASQFIEEHSKSGQLQENHLLDGPQKNPYFFCHNETSDWKQDKLLNFDPKALRQQLVSTRYNFKMFIDSWDRTVSQNIYRDGTWEPAKINIIGKIVKPSHNVINIGSQSGLQAVIIGQIIGKGGNLFIVEPYNFSNYLVNLNLKLNGLEEISTVYLAGASDQTSVGQICVKYSNTGAATIDLKFQLSKTKRRLKNCDEARDVVLERVDALLPDDMKADFLLIDAEKMQIKALRGLRRVIQRSPKLVIMVEWNYSIDQNKDKEVTKEVLDYLVSKGYKFYKYLGSTDKCRVGEFDEINGARMLVIGPTDVFMFPETVPLPRK